MTMRSTRSECLVDGRWLLMRGGSTADTVAAWLDADEERTVRGETERFSEKNGTWVRIAKTAVAKTRRITVTAVYDGVRAVVLGFDGCSADLFDGTGQGNRRGWPGNMHDGSQISVPVSELGEVTESVQEFDAEGNRLS